MFWAKDSFRGDDKLWHFIGGFVSPLVYYVVFWPSVLSAVIMSLIFWVAWEIKDGYVLRWNVIRWVKKKEMGFWLGDLLIWLSGEGFSWKNVLLSWFGVLLGWGIVEAMNYLAIGL